LDDDGHTRLDVEVEAEVQWKAGVILERSAMRGPEEIPICTAFETDERSFVLLGEAQRLFADGSCQPMLIGMLL